MTSKSPLQVVDDDYTSDSSEFSAAEFSELGLADTWVERSGGRWRYVAEWDAWYEWRADGWYKDETDAAKASIMEYMREASSWSGYLALTQQGRRALQSNKTVNAIRSLAQAHRGVALPAEAWDTNTMLLGVPGGVIDLRTATMIQATPTQFISMRCAVAPAAGVPKLWLAHLHRVMRGNVELIEFLQRYFGYMLTGEVGEHALIFLYGHGANGKGTMIESVVRIMGNYGYAAPVNLLMESKNERHPVELAMLRGKRAVSCSEPPQGARWDDGRIRSLTGGDTVTARLMGENLSSFAPTHKLLLMGNHKPTLRSVDEAVRRRFNIIDFSYTIPTEERDPRFMEKLEHEWPQILQWMIDGCLLWQENGLDRPASMVEATVEYLEVEDTMGQFMAECCDIGPTKFDTVATLFLCYRSWCEKCGEKAMSRKGFMSMLFETAGVERKKSSQGDTAYGLSVNDRHRPNASRWDMG